MKQVFSTSRGVIVDDVPAPTLPAGGVLVRTAFSCVSPGTEVAGIRRAEEPLLRALLKDAAKARQAVDRLVDDGPAGLRRAARTRAERLVLLGYSASGVVETVGPGVFDLKPGARVACAGAGAANHAEWLAVPRNLVARVPDGVTLADAALTTIGAIALQGVRRAEPTMGETFVVIGLGLLGQLTVRLLRANGCRAIVTDTDHARVERALEAGAAASVDVDSSLLPRVAQLTSGVGADGVIITASTASSEVIASALQMCRKRGRVVVVGDVGMDIDRADMYEKELDLRISTSYGPGRYDRAYENEGLDYPIGHVRWTENRNMEAILGLLAEGALAVEDLVDRRFPIDEAAEAYVALDAEPRPLTVLLEYPSQVAAERSTTMTTGRTASPGRLGIAVIGAGSFARSIHLPNLDRLRDRLDVVAIVAATGASAVATARVYGAQIAATDHHAVLADERVDAVLIVARHDVHARIALDALRAGKHVLVEKPLALTADDLDELAAFYEREPHGPVLMTGYNRRFSPLTRELRTWLAIHGTPVMTYTFNAGFVPADHWVHGREGGGRNVGEACHAYDLMRHLAAAPIASAIASAATPRSGRYRRDDNFTAVLTFDDGSLGALTYTAMGGASWKERLTVHAGEATAELTDWTSLSFSDRATVKLKHPDKGHLEELRVFVNACATGDWPIPLGEQLEVARVALAIDRPLRGA